MPSNAPAGADLIFGEARWLTPPANFLWPSGPLEFPLALRAARISSAPPGRVNSMALTTLISAALLENVAPRAGRAYGRGAGGVKL